MAGERDMYWNAMATGRGVMRAPGRPEPWSKLRERLRDMLKRTPVKVVGRDDVITKEMEDEAFSHIGPWNVFDAENGLRLVLVKRVTDFVVLVWPYNWDKDITQAEATLMVIDSIARLLGAGLPGYEETGVGVWNGEIFTMRFKHHEKVCN